MRKPHEDQSSSKVAFPQAEIKVTPPQNEHLVINHLPPCRPKPVKALFVFGMQFKIFWMKTGRHHTDRFSTFIYTYPCGAADTEQRTQFTFSGYSTK